MSILKHIFSICFTALMTFMVVNSKAQIAGPLLSITDPHRGDATNRPLPPSVIINNQETEGYDFNALFTFDYLFLNPFTVPTNGTHELFLVFNAPTYIDYLRDNNNLVGLSHDPRVSISELIGSNTVKITLNANASFSGPDDVFSVSFRVKYLQPGTSITGIQTSALLTGQSNPSQNSFSFNIGVTPLPITLGAFHAIKLTNKTGKVYWETLKEENNKGFWVQKSKNGQNWIDWKYTESKAPGGESITPLQYELLDEHPHQGTNMYRLKTVALDGNISYSDVRHLVFDFPASNLIIYPNPSNDFISVQSDHPINNIVLLTSNGISVYQEELSTEPLTHIIKTDSYPSGNYIIQVQTSDGSITQNKLSIVH